MPTPSTISRTHLVEWKIMLSEVSGTIFGVILFFQLKGIFSIKFISSVLFVQLIISSNTHTSKIDASEDYLAPVVWPDRILVRDNLIRGGFAHTKVRSEKILSPITSDQKQNRVHFLRKFLCIFHWQMLCLTRVNNTPAFWSNTRLESVGTNQNQRVQLIAINGSHERWFWIRKDQRVFVQSFSSLSIDSKTRVNDISTHLVF